MADAARVTCGECNHRHEILAASDAWKCACHAVRDDCGCDAVNSAPGTEDNPPETNESDEIAALQARLALLTSGGATPRGEVAP